MRHVDELKVVVAHDFAEAYGGAERVIASAVEALPVTEFWTLVGRQAVVERMKLVDRWHTVLPPWEPLLAHYRLLAPAFPSIVRMRRLPEADVLLSSSYAFAHGFQTRNGAPHVCYCHSPLRFAWTMTEQYGSERGGRVAPALLKALARAMRAMDRNAAARPTRYVANSAYVAEQIARLYGRRADVVFPPVDCRRFFPGSAPHEDFFLFCGRLVEPYKRPSLAVEAFARMPEHRLVVAGEGPELARLRQIAPANVEFTGHLDDDRLIPLMQGCTAAVFPSHDDFGMIPVEVMACGRPVIAFRGGGALETVREGVTGEFFDRQDADSLVTAVRGFEASRYDPAAIRKHAEGWHVDRFQESMRRIVAETAAMA